MAETRFEGNSPVARYWLTRCEGFAVRGGSSGVVESLIREADPHATAWLVVRTRGRRRQAVPVDAVASVDPAERVVVVERPEREARIGPAVREATAVTARAARTVSATSARAVAPRVRSGAWSGARAARVATAATARAARTATATSAHAITPRARSGAQAARTATGATMRSLARRVAPARAAVAAVLQGVVVTLVQSFRSLAAEARHPKPYVPANRSASSRTRSDAGSPTTFR
jgi:hypothetical protein